MNCNDKITKKIWEDWDFFFKMQKEDWTFEDLNWYSYSFILEDINKVEKIRDSWNITSSWTELVKTISWSDTASYSEWTYFVEFKITDTNWKVHITDRAKLYGSWTLHNN